MVGYPIVGAVAQGAEGVSFLLPPAIPLYVVLV